MQLCSLILKLYLISIFNSLAYDYNTTQVEIRKLNGENTDFLKNFCFSGKKPL
jgi:hypothetical protein